MPARLVRLVASTALAALAVACPPAWAGAPTCSVTASGVAFGFYDARLAFPSESTGTVAVTCSSVDGTPGTVLYGIALGPGTAGSYAPRRLSGAGPTLEYNLFLDASRQVVWGDGSGATGVVSGGHDVSATPETHSYPVYGQIGARQDVPPGPYSDTITVTVNY
jgi:spore coat protein U-like protein